MKRALALLFVTVAGCSTLGGGRSEAEVDFDQADSLYASGEYAAAAEAYETSLWRTPNAPNADAVLLRLAVIYMTTGTPERDPARGASALQRLIESYPSSRLREPAEYILELRRRVARLERGSRNARARVAELEGQLEEIKRIDLGRD